MEEYVCTVCVLFRFLFGFLNVFYSSLSLFFFVGIVVTVSLVPEERYGFSRGISRSQGGF